MLGISYFWYLIEDEPIILSSDDQNIHGSSPLRRLKLFPSLAIGGASAYNSYQKDVLPPIKVL